MTRPSFSRTCAECGAPFIAHARTAEFCSSPCRLAANNRRMARGARLYDLYVHKRFNREAATEAGLHAVIDRMVSNWVEEDRAAGRRAMRPLQDCLDAAVEHRAVRYATRRVSRPSTGVHPAHEGYAPIAKGKYLGP